MKYLDYPILIQLSDSLSAKPLPEMKVNVRFEAYAVKPVTKERKMFKEMEEHYMSEQESMDEMSFSPEMREAGLSSCFGRLDERESRKVHFLLVSTLNSAFPDHEFSSLRPDHFMREITSGQALQDVTERLLGPSGGIPFSLGKLTLPSNTSKLGTSAPNHLSSSPLSGSPAGIIPQIGNPDLYRVLNEVVALDECEVYSWMPEPEYDPHMQPEDGEVSDEEFGLDESEETLVEEMEVDEDGDLPVSWGQAGMELDDIPESRALKTKRSYSRGFVGSSPIIRPVMGSMDRNKGLLWSANYFFYSKRQKRMLFITLWSRKLASSTLVTPPDDTSFFPLAISSAITPASPPTLTPRSPQTQTRSRTRPNPINRQLRHASSKPDIHSTIPIRGMTPNPRHQSSSHSHSRLATSAPSSFVPQDPQLVMAKMTKGGFRPKQTAAREKMNELARLKGAESGKGGKGVGGSATTRGGNASGGVGEKRFKVPGTV